MLIFVDVNPKGFQAIADYLNDMKISSIEDPPDHPSVGDEYYHTLMHQAKLFEIAKFDLLYRSSRDGLSAQDFHSKRDHGVEAPGGASE